MTINKLPMVTGKNYETIWDSLETGSIITWGKALRYADVAWHARRFDKGIIPLGLIDSSTFANT